MALAPNSIRAVRARATRAKLLAAATEMFDAHGYDGVDIRIIANTADVSTGAIFGHFLNKEDLFAAVYPEDHMRRRVGEAMCRATGEPWDAVDREAWFAAADVGLSALPVAERVAA